SPGFVGFSFVLLVYFITVKSVNEAFFVSVLLRGKSDAFLLAFYYGEKVTLFASGLLRRLVC
ncbi:MAG: hypothetical protein ACREBR_01455, partial [bacterium]